MTHKEYMRHFRELQNTATYENNNNKAAFEALTTEYLQNMEPPDRAKEAAERAETIAIFADLDEPMTYSCDHAVPHNGTSCVKCGYRW